MLKEQILYSLLGLILISFLLFISIVGIRKSEKVECKNWQQADYNYFTEWQKQQCKNYGIEL